MLRDYFLKFVFGCIEVWEQLWAFIGFILTPLRPLIMSSIIKWMEKYYGIEAVNHPPKKPNQVYIKDSKELYKQCVRNFGFGTYSCHDKGIVEMDPRHIIKNIPKDKRWILKDSYHFLSLMVNIQAGTYGWEVANHYDTGTQVSIISLRAPSGLV